MGVQTKTIGLLTTSTFAGLFVMLAFVQSAKAENYAWTPDVFILRCLMPAIIYGAVFIAGHMALRHFRYTQVATYCGLGAIAFNASFYGSFGPEVIAKAGSDGVALIVGAAVFAFGSLLGFSYRRTAGVDVAGDDPAELANMLASTDAADTAHVTTQEAEYYDGPLQVKTSSHAVILASLAGGGAFSFVNSMLFVAVEILMGRSMGNAFFATYFDNMASTHGLLGYAAYGLLIGLILLPLPVYLCHKFCQSRGWTQSHYYLVVGLAAPVIIGLCMFVVGLVLTVRLILPLGLAMVVYRQLAGLEPLSLPEDIEVSDRRTLIGADHARRRYSRVT